MKVEPNSSNMTLRIERENMDILDIMEFDFDDIKLDHVNSSSGHEFHLLEKGALQVMADGQKVFFTQENFEHQGDKNEKLFEFKVLDNDKSLIAECDLFIHNRGELYERFGVPVTSVSVNKSADRDLTDRYPLIGRILVAKAYQFIFRYMKGNAFVDIIARDPNMSEIDDQLSPEEWLGLFDDFLDANNYQEIEKTDCGEDQWFKVYNEE